MHVFKNATIILSLINIHICIFRCCKCRFMCLQTLETYSHSKGTVRVEYGCDSLLVSCAKSAGTSLDKKKKKTTC